MAGSKRGGFRGGGGGASKKSFAKKRSAEDDDDASRSKKAKGEDEESGLIVPKLAIDDDGNQFVGLNASGKRRVTVSDFNKSTLISIREYWVNDAGELKPGKKGISLTVDQYNTLLAAAPLIESALAKKDIEIVRPDYDAKPNVEEETVKADDAAEGSEEEEVVGKIDDEEDNE